MVLKKFWGKQDDEVYQDYTLSTMKKGDLVDFDLKTWQVIGYNTYDYDGFVTWEWELSCSDDVRFLEAAEEDGRIEWTWTRRIDLQQIEEDVAGKIIETDDPPPKVCYEGRHYEAVESSAGLQRRGGDERSPRVRQLELRIQGGAIAIRTPVGRAGLHRLRRRGRRGVPIHRYSAWRERMRW